MNECWSMLPYEVASIDSSFTAQSRRVEVWTLTGPLQQLDLFLFQSLCGRFSAVLGIIAPFYDPVW